MAHHDAADHASAHGQQGHVHAHAAPSSQLSGVHMMEMMQMTFYVSNEVTLLFDQWKTSTPGGMFWSCVAIVVLGLIYEALTLGYLLMLIFMTFNVYVCVAVVLGLSMGYFLFGWRMCPGDELAADHCG